MNKYSTHTAVLSTPGTECKVTRLEQPKVACAYCDVKQTPQDVELCVCCGAPLGEDHSAPRGVLMLQGISAQDFEDAVKEKQKTDFHNMLKKRALLDAGW